MEDSFNVEIDDGLGTFCVLAEMSVRAAFAGRAKAVAIVEKYNHNCRLGFDDKLERICGNNYFREIPLSLQ